MSRASTDDVMPEASRSGVVRAVTFPFRLVLGVVSAIATLGRLLLKTIQLPLRAVVGAISLILNVAADITFGVWRVAYALISTVLRIAGGVLKQVVHVWNLLGKLGYSLTQRLGIVGTVIRVVVGTVVRVIGLIVGVAVGLVTTIGKAAASAVVAVADVVVGVVGGVVHGLLVVLGLKKRKPKKASDVDDELVA